MQYGMVDWILENWEKRKKRKDIHENSGKTQVKLVVCEIVTHPG